MKAQKVSRSKSRLRRIKKRLMRNWWIWLTILIIAALGLAMIPSRPTPKPSPRATKSVSGNSSVATTVRRVTYGVAMGGTLSGVSSSKRAAILSKIKKAGFSEIRVNLNWVDAEPTQGKISWAANDALMQAIKKSGLRMVALIDRVPPWARLSMCQTDVSCAPANASDYAKFAATAASRYKDFDVAAWEVWNEENSNNFWKPLPDPSSYAGLLTATYAAIKQANPNAVVLVGGLSGDSVDKLGAKLIDPRTYLSKLYDDGAKGTFDGIGYHPYLGVGLPSKQSDYNGWLKMSDDNTSMRSVMIAHGDQGKDIWITEFGIPTGGVGATVTDPALINKGADHATPEAQSQIVQSALDDLKQKPWVKSFDWYTYMDSASAATTTGSSYGLWQYDGKEKPVLKVLQSAMKTELP